VTPMEMGMAIFQVISTLIAKPTCSNAIRLFIIEGLTSRLDYLAALGVNVIWLLPIYPSPLKDDGACISNEE